MSRTRRRGLRAVPQAAVAAVVVLGLAPAVAALGPPGIGEPLSPEQIHACLCLEQRIDDLRREIALRDSLSKEREAELNEIEEEIQRRRATMSIDDPAAIRELRQLVARQQVLRDLLYNELRGVQRDGVERLNDRVETYNELCAARLTAGADIDRMKESLRCPTS